MGCTKEEWMNLKMSEMYGMYSNMVKRSIKNEESIDKLIKENYDLNMRLNKLEKEFSLC